MHAEEPLEPEGAGERLVRKTPWWGVSVGIHTVGLLVLSFFWLVNAAPEETIITVPHPKPRPPIPDMKPPERDPRPNPLDVKPDKEVFVDKYLPKDQKLESEDEDEAELFKGQSLEYVSTKPFDSKSTNDAIGPQGGASGRFGHRRGGKKWRGVTDGGGGEETERSVLDALEWLARHQSPDGSWKVQTYVRQCSQPCSPNPGFEDFDAGVTGLALLAFLGAGYSHLSKDVHGGLCFGDVVRKGLQWMMSHQDPEGCIGSRAAPKYMYNHTICALAMTEAYGLTGSGLFKDNAQRAVDFTVAAQNPGKGWRYAYKPGDSDSSVTGWAVMVLKSAELSGLGFPRSGYDGTRVWYDEVTERGYPRVGYTQAATGKVFVPGLNEHFEHHEALTAIGVMARIFMDKTKGDPRVSGGCDLLLRDKPKWEGNLIDFYYWYYASLALFQFDGPTGSKWRAWNEDMKNALVKNQNLPGAGCRRGSWEPVDRWSGEGGRVYATAINALTLEVYYRYANVFGGGR